MEKYILEKKYILVESRSNHMEVHWIQKISILTPWRLIGNSKGVGVSKTNIFDVQFV